MSYGRHRQEEVECNIMHMGGLEYTFLHESPISTPRVHGMSYNCIIDPIRNEIDRFAHLSSS